MPSDIGVPVLSDIGEAVDGDKTRHYDSQPELYRSPEVMLEADWSYPVDIWSLGVMVRLSTSWAVLVFASSSRC